MHVLTKAQKDSIIAFAESCVSDNDPQHSMAHLKETAELAGSLARSESADVSISWAAGMLHDICKNDKGDHGALGAEKAADFLASIGLPSSLVDPVYDAILFHNKEFKDGPKERMVVWDADKLPLMDPEGFMSRIVPYWVERLGRKAGIAKAIEDYQFFRIRFHTKTAKQAVEANRGAMEGLFAELGYGR